MKEGSGAGAVPRTNGSESRSNRPKSYGSGSAALVVARNGTTSIVTVEPLFKQKPFNLVIYQNFYPSGMVLVVKW
jgi:hypothetical protein